MSDTGDHPNGREEDETEEDRQQREEAQAQSDGVELDVGLSPVTDLLDEFPDGGDTGEQENSFDAANDPTDVDHRVDEPSAEYSDGFCVDTYRTDSELVVVADLPHVDKDDVSVGLHRRTNDLVIAVDGQVIERVAVPWPRVLSTRVTFNNGVLEIHLAPPSPGV